jgi:hypothetical protein
MATQYTNQGHKRILEMWPDAPTTVPDKLAHVLDVYHELDDSMDVLTATLGIYGTNVKTGLTLGDLRVLHEVINGNYGGI